MIMVFKAKSITKLRKVNNGRFKTASSDKNDMAAKVIMNRLTVNKIVLQASSAPLKLCHNFQAEHTSLIVRRRTHFFSAVK